MDSCHSEEKSQLETGGVPNSAATMGLVTFSMEEFRMRPCPKCEKLVGPGRLMQICEDGPLEPWLHGACHVGAGVEAEYKKGQITFNCNKCKKHIATIAVATKSRWN